MVFAIGITKAEDCERPRFDLSSAMSWLCRSCCPNSTPEDERRILLDFFRNSTAADIPTAQALDLIANYPASVRQRDPEDDSYPIHVACSHGTGVELIVLQALVEAWPASLSTVTARDYDSPLYVACCHEMNAECIAYMGQKHPQALSKRNHRNELPLHPAAAHGWLDVLQYLVNEYPRAAACKNWRGNLPLHSLVKGHPRAMAEIRLLVKTFPEAIESQNFDGETPLHLLMSSRQETTTLPVLLYLLLEYSSVASRACLLKNGDYGDTVLHSTCRNARSPTVLPLIQVLVQANRQALEEKNKAQQ